MKEIRAYFRHALLVISILALGLVVVSAPARRANFPGVTIDNFGKINENYYRGSQPSQEEFTQLKGLGIRTVIDLREDYKKDEESWVRGLGMNYFRIPLKTRVAATDEQTASFLSLVSDPAKLPVYVHCKGGRHRTGAMTAIYRITHDGWTADQAWQEMKDYDFDNNIFGGPAAQKRYVYSFFERRRTSSSTTREE